MRQRRYVNCPAEKRKAERPQSTAAASQLASGSTQACRANSGRLLEDISKLDARFCGVMDNPRRLDRVRGFGGANSPYEDFAPEIHAAATSCRAVFDEGQLRLAREAYNALFKLLMRKDSYGFPVAVPTQLNMRQEYPRYLRAVVETTPPDQQAVILVESWRNLRSGIWDADKITITGILQCRPEPLETLKRILQEIIPHLRAGRDIQDDRWMREAVRLRSGISGLLEFARREGERRPYAWLDLLHSMAMDGDPAALLSVAREALTTIPDGLDLRAAAADFWCRSATACGDAEQALEALWEAFRANPIPARLLDLRDAAVRQSVDQEWLERALKYAREGGLAVLPGPQMEYTGRVGNRIFLEEGDGFHDYSCKGMIASIQLLAGHWRPALADAKKEAVTGWSQNAQGLVIPVLLAWLAGWPSVSTPVSVNGLVDEALSLLDSPDRALSRIGVRYRQALTESISRWETPPAASRSKLISRCISLIQAYLNMVARQHYSGLYKSAATFSKGAAQVLAMNDSISSGKQFLDRLVARHKRNSELARHLASKD